MTQTPLPLHRGAMPLKRLRASLLALAALALTACVYRIDIQQGNLLDDDDINQVDVGMTRSQVQFLLGTPMVADSFHRDRWDYAYYYRQGRSPDLIKRWIVVYFENDRVARIERDLELEPAG
jgi:outer membrane protein assembly factor BamE